MSERLPLPWLLQMSIYNVKIGGENVITRVADREATMSHGISELRHDMKADPNPIVGIDVVNSGDLLLFYVKKRCLIIQYNRILALNDKYQVPSFLASFLQDKNITFVGPRHINNKSFTWSGVYQKFDFKTVVDVGYLAAQICKKPRLLSSTLEELMLEVDVEIMRPIIGNGSLRHKWESSAVLSEEEVKVAIYEVYSCYQIATKVIEVMQTGVTTHG
uniref:3'-5' exonuclease domain-containing protein n=1 Tax=Solanum lycopersicum TaxID=4081 RepID=A0A3Q7EK48_SOLLC